MADDIRSLLAALDAEVERISDRVTVAIRKTAFDVQETAQQLAPVDTGFLRSSIGEPTFTVEPGALIIAEIGPTAEYGPFVEYGTHRTGPQPYMGPAADRHEPLLEQAIGQIVGQDLR